MRLIPVERSECHECMDGSSDSGVRRARAGDRAPGVGATCGLSRLPPAFAEADLVVAHARVAWQVGLPGVRLPDRSQGAKIRAARAPGRNAAGKQAELAG